MFVQLSSGVLSRKADNRLLRCISYTYQRRIIKTEILADIHVESARFT